MIAAELSRRADALRERRTPFVVATVVRAQRPTSVRAGDSALVLGDGSVAGFVGGACAEQSVRLHALRALETGEALLLRILPGDGEAPAAEGAVTVQNPCLSGGALEIFLEPVLPAPRVLVVGETPVADALERLGSRVGLDMGRAGEPELAVVVASHGHDELGALRAALESGVPYVGLVASRRRGTAIREELAGTRGLEALDTPAGLDIGARTPEEIALSILARIVQVRRTAHAAPPAPRRAAGGPTPVHPSDTSRPGGGSAAVRGVVEGAVDPVCGMTVAVTPATPRAEHQGGTVHFCCEGCRATFEQDPDRFAVAR